MKAYWIARVNVDDKEAYTEYAKRVGPALKKYNGKFLVRGGKKIVTEGKNFVRTVVIEFNSFDVAKEFFYSSEYQAAHELLKDKKVVRNHQIIEGS